MMAENMRFILASASPRRLDILKRLKLKPSDVIPADIDESPLSNELPKQHALRLAEQKALKVYRDLENTENTVILAADTVVSCGRRILPKTETVEEAKECLELLSGRRHRVYGGIALHVNGKLLSRVVDTHVTMKRLHSTEIQDYLDSGEWQSVAGGYKIQGLAESFIKQINGTHSNIVGLCLYNTRQMLLGNCPDIFKTNASDD